ncbi:hypothetical protein SAMD00019534_029460, partial [Acytostelium subglobosum LB1]|uniref:hypothetical protein n=1 Tax=Acytostelium subglobosum LB1 TaxID=1410327 RepID=UPI000644D621
MDSFDDDDDQLNQQRQSSVLDSVNISDLKVVDDAVNSNISVNKFIETYNDETQIYYMIYTFKNTSTSPVFIWIGESASSPSINALLVSMKIPMDNVPAVSHLLYNSSDNNSQSIIKRIVIKYNTQAFLSYNIGQDIIEKNIFVERKLFEHLKQLLPQPVNTQT